MNIDEKPWTEMTPAERRAFWCAKLRSGEYAQGRSQLRNDYAFCCLGVLCDISGRGKWDGDIYVMPRLLGHDDVDLFDDSKYHLHPPLILLDDAGLTPSLSRRLADMNDDDGASFSEIANAIEEAFEDGEAEVTL